MPPSNVHGRGQLHMQDSAIKHETKAELFDGAGVAPLQKPGKVF